MIMPRSTAWKSLRHGHGKTLDNDIIVEGLEHVFRCQGVVNSGVFVVVETFQLLLTNVHHLEFRIMH